MPVGCVPDSVVGLNFDFLFLNFTKHTSYLLYNALLYFSPVIQQQYREKYGQSEVGVYFLPTISHSLHLDDKQHATRRLFHQCGVLISRVSCGAWQLIPVALSDVAFSVHAVLLTVITVSQIYAYEVGSSGWSRESRGVQSHLRTGGFDKILSVAGRLCVSQLLTFFAVAFLEGSSNAVSARCRRHCGSMDSSLGPGYCLRDQGAVALDRVGVQVSVLACIGCGKVIKHKIVACANFAFQGRAGHGLQVC